MPNPKSQADIIHDAEGLLEAAERSPEAMRQEIEKERQVLARSLAELKVHKAVQEELTAKRQEATQRLAASVAQVKEAAITFRSLVRAKLGPRNERLVHFKVPPIRRRPRQRKAAEQAPGTEPD
jgi:hypothetical protein